MKKLLLVFTTIALALGLVYLPELFHPGGSVLEFPAPESPDKTNGVAHDAEKEAALSEKEDYKDLAILNDAIRFNDSTYLRNITEIRDDSDPSSLKYKRASLILTILEIVKDTSRIPMHQKIDLMKLYRDEIISRTEEVENKQSKVINDIQNDQLRRLLNLPPK